MTTTGYEIKLTRRVESKLTGYKESSTDVVHWCVDCVEDAPVSTSDSKVIEVSTSRFDHGTGEEKPCVSCGLDINGIMAGRIVRGRKEPEAWHYVEDPPKPSLELVASIVDERDEGAFVMIRRAPGETAEEVQLTPYAKFVHSRNAEKTLVVERGKQEYKNGDVVRERTDDKMDAWADKIEGYLQAFGLNTTVVPDYYDDGDYWCVLGAR